MKDVDLLLEAVALFGGQFLAFLLEESSMGCSCEWDSVLLETGVV